MLVKARTFSRSEYHRLAETGVLTEDDRVELLQGNITALSPIGPYHSGVVDFLADFFKQALGRTAIVRVQNPLAAGKDSEPQPDLMLLAPRDDFYRHAHPTPTEVRLLIEVAEASLEVDCDFKARLYARAEVAEYWVIDLVRQMVIVHRQPAGERYADISTHGRGTRVGPAALLDVQLTVADCFI